MGALNAMHRTLRSDQMMRALKQGGTPPPGVTIKPGSQRFTGIDPEARPAMLAQARQQQQGDQMDPRRRRARRGGRGRNQLGAVRSVLAGEGTGALQ